ncbi:MAG: AmmeMemoRadiSam system protein B, partial [Candidatus Omnitrophica bacterium]|nr:AmmeMemoRadiSam system protein B [Candidatus Omnitrophota bacterium]
EVELPILNHFFGDFKFVPIACKSETITEYKEVAKQIFEAIKSLKGLGENILLVASSDFTHYEPEQTARKKDLQAIEAIINLDEEELIKRIHKENITLCGEAPLAIFISCLKLLGARKSQVVLYQTSGDATGNRSSVVGYAGIIVQ